MSKKRPVVWDAPSLSDLKGNIDIGAASTVNKDEFLPYMPNGVYDTGNIQLERAQNQSTMGQIGKFVGNTILNAGIGLVETVGYLGSLANEWGDDRDYSNPMIEMAQEWKNPFGEIYRENPEETWDLADPAWWSNHGSGLISSVAQFAVAGAGIGSVLGKGTSALAKAGIMNSRLASMAAQTGTAAALAYTEGAMAATEVYKSTYDTQIEKFLSDGMDPEEANARATKIASQSAATTAQINTAINTVLNLGAVSPLFKEMRANGEFFRKGAGARQAKESLDEWADRLRQLDEKSSAVKELLGRKSVSHYAAESFKEGGEEMVNQFAEYTGMELGEAGKTKGLLDQFDELESFFARTMNEEGALNFVLGAVGGAGNTVALDFMPVHRDFVRNSDGTLKERTDENGEVVTNSKGEVQYERKYYNGRFLENNQRVARFNSAKEAVMHDINKVSELNVELQRAVDSGDALAAQRVRKELLSTHYLGAILRGEGESWKTEYAKYRDLDNTIDLGEEAQKEAQELQSQMDELLSQEGVEDATQLTGEAQEAFVQLEQQLQTKSEEAAQLTGKTEAMLKGFASSKNDNEYRQRATEAIADLELFDKWNEDLKSKFSRYQEEDLEMGLVSGILVKKINDHYDARALENIEQAIGELEIGTVSNVDTSDVDALVQQANNQYVYGLTMSEEYNQKAQMLDNGVNVDDILASFGVEFTEETKDKAAKSLASRLKELSKARRADTEEFLEFLRNSPDYMAWAKKAQNKKSGNDIQDFINWLHGQATDNEALVRAYRAKDEISARREVTQEQIKEIEKSPRKYIQSLRKDLNKAKAEFEERMKFVDSQVTDKINERLAALNYRIDRDTLIAKKLEDEVKSLTPKYNQALANYNQYVDSTKNATVPAVRAKRARRLFNIATKLEAKILAKQAVIDKVNSELATNRKRAENPKEDIKKVEQPKPDEKDLQTRLNEVRREFLSAMSRVQTKVAKFHMSVALDKFLSEKGIKRSDVANEFYENILTDAYDELAGRLMSDREKMTFPIEVEINNILEKVNPALADDIRTMLFARGADMSDATHSWDVLDIYIEGKELSQAQATKLIALTEKVRAIRKRFRTDGDGFLGGDLTSSDVDEDAINLDEMGVEELGAYFYDLYPEQFQSPETASDDFATLLARRGSPDRPLTAEEDAVLRKHLAEDQPEEQPEPVVLTDLSEEELAAYFFNLYPNELGTLEATINGLPLLLELNGTADRPLSEEEADAIRGYSILNNGMSEDPDYISDEEEDLPEEVLTMFETDKNRTSVGVAALHLKYETIEENGVARNVSTELNREANLDVLLPENSTAGSEMTLRVLPGYTGKVYNHDSSDRERVDARPTVLVNGKIPEDAYDSVPIEIIDNKTGKRVGFVHTMSWVTERKGDFRNVLVAEDFEEGDPRRDSLPSIEDLISSLSQLREQAITRYHQGQDSTINVRQKGAGRLITLQEQGSASDLLPDDNLQIAVTLKGNKVTPYVEIPMADGSIVQSHLGTSVIPDEDVDVMIEAIKVYAAFWNPKASQQEKADARRKAESLKELTGFDPTNSMNLKAFINQYYTNTNSFTEQDLQIKDGGGGSRFLFDIIPGKVSFKKEVERGNIKIGQSGRGDNAIYAILEDGSLNPFFEPEFRKGIKTHKKAPMPSLQGASKMDPESKEAKEYATHIGTLRDVNGLGSEVPIQEVRISEGGFVAKGKPHKNYNAYAKTFTTTKVDGRNKVGNRYIYAVHPVIELDPITIRSQHEDSGAAGIVQTEGAPVTNIEVEPVQTQDQEEELEWDEDESNDLFSRVLPSDSDAFIRSQLVRLREQADKTNDKTIEEAFQELKRLNLSQIPEGYNPFRKC